MPLLTSLPPEILGNIAFHAVCSDHKPSLGPPSQLIPLLLICKSLNTQLHSSGLRARIFKAQFDSSAIQRRAFKPTSSEFAEQLAHYWRFLRTVRQQVIYDEDDHDIDTTLVVVHLMLLEDDGKNSAQLHAVNAYQWTRKLVLNRLNEDAQNGWPTECLRNSLAVWNMWMLTRAEFLREETDEEDDQLRNLLLPFVSFAPRYPTTFAPSNHFHLPLPDEFRSNPYPDSSIPTSHGFYPPYLAPQPNAVFHYSDDFDIRCPPVAPAAKLLYFARKELYPFGIPLIMAADRDEAIATRGEEGRRIITKADIEEWNGQGPQVNPAFPGGNILPPVKGWDDGVEWSRGWDADFNRLMVCSGQETSADGGPLRVRMGPVYTPGSLSGLWAGRMAWSNDQRLQTLFFHPPELVPAHTPPQEQPPSIPDGPPTLPTDFSEDYLGLRAGAVYMRLEEHVVFSPGRILPCGGPRPVSDMQMTEASSSTRTEQGLFADREAAFDQGMLEAWVPQGLQWRRVPDYKYASTVPEVEPDAEAALASSFGVGVEPVLKPDQIVQFGFGNSVPRWDGMDEKFIYQTIAALPLTKETAVPPKEDGKAPQSVESSSYSSLKDALGPPPASPSSTAEETRKINILPSSVYPNERGRFHDRENCPGCVLRETAARKRRQDESAAPSPPSSCDSGDDDEDEEDDSSADCSPAERPWGTRDLENVSPCPGVLDVLLTGSTDPRHGAAWNPYIYQGRIRLYDGLICLLRTPAVALDNSNSNANHGSPTETENVKALGRIVFYGYLIGGRNFVGNYRVVGAGDVGVPGWEGAFSLGRRE